MNFLRSFIKSFRLSSYQKKYIDLLGQSMDFSNPSTQRETEKKREELFSAYLDFCLRDPNIKEIARTYELSKTDLVALYPNISKMHSLSQVIHGHYALLSTFAYAEPLEFLIVSLKDGLEPIEINNHLFKYWMENKYFYLFNLISSSPNFRKR